MVYINKNPRTMTCKMREISNWSLGCAGRLVRCLGVRLHPPGGPGEGQGTALNHRQSGKIMDRILNGNPEIGAHVRSNHFYLICLRLVIRSRVVKNRMFFIRKDVFSFMYAQYVLIYHLIYKYHG